jgi:hypothetical protein
MHSVGDPILWPDLPAALEIGKRAGARTWIFTCAITEDRSLLEAICRNANVVEISLNSTSREDYLQTKGVDCFSQVVDNLQYMRSLTMPGTPVRLIASRTQTNDESTDKAFTEHWKSSGLVDDAFVRSYHTYNELLPELGRRGNIPGHSPCLVHWARFNINVEGHAVVCFNELFRNKLDAGLIFGDLQQQTVAEIWHGTKLSALRHAELTADYSDLSFRDVLPCKTCTSCQPLSSDRPTSESQILNLASQQRCPE